MPEITGSLDTPPFVMRSSGGKRVLSVLGSAAFVGVSVWMIRTGETPRAVGIGWVCGVVFLLLLVIHLIKAWKPDRLTLRPEGLRLETFQGVIVDAPWSALGDFELRTHRGSSYVVLNVAPGFRDSVRWQVLTRPMAGADVALGGGWPVGSGEMLGLLERAHSMWAGAIPTRFKPDA